MYVYMQVQCDKCDCWQHIDCIETAKQRIEYKDKSFFCLTCTNDAGTIIYSPIAVINYIYSYIAIYGNVILLYIAS